MNTFYLLFSVTYWIALALPLQLEVTTLSDAWAALGIIPHIQRVSNRIVITYRRRLDFNGIPSYNSYHFTYEECRAVPMPCIQSR